MPLWNITVNFTIKIKDVPKTSRLVIFFCYMHVNIIVNFRRSKPAGKS